jgi:hypothetical protein
VWARRGEDAIAAIDLVDVYEEVSKATGLVKVYAKVRRL